MSAALELPAAPRPGGRPVGRRAFLRGAGMAAAGLAVGSRMRIARATATGGHTLVTVFLRGGLDGIGAVVPYNDPGYADLDRPFKVPAAEAAAHDLDGLFGFHPALAPLLPLYRSGSLAVVHAVGNPGGTRSHFEEMRVIEHGGAGTADPHEGWISRHLRTRPGDAGGVLQAMAVADRPPMSLTGTPAVAVNRLEDFRVVMAHGSAALNSGAHLALESTHDGSSAIDVTGRRTLAAVDAVQQQLAAHPDSGDDPAATPYPEWGLGVDLRQAARAITSGLGVEAVTIDFGGWDLHRDAGTVDDGPFRRQLDHLALSLRAFHDDLGPKMADVTVVVQSEFGRRLAANGSRGTDHGHGGVMFVMGGGINGGRVFGDWRSIATDGNDGGDLAVLTDYRTVLADLLTTRLGNPDVATVFPGMGTTPTSLGIG